MRLASTIVSVIFIFLCGVWILQGANILKGPAMISGQSQWLYIGIGVLLVGLAALWWSFRNRT